MNIMIEMWLCEDKLNSKTAHGQFSSVACLSSLKSLYKRNVFNVPGYFTYVRLNLLWIIRSGK